MADAAMFAGYRQYQGNGTGHPLWVPDSTLSDLAQQVEALEKAQGETREQQALQAKMGSLFSMYYSLWANLVQWGAAEKPRHTPTHRLLRETARGSLIDKLIINARTHQIRHVAHRVVVEGKQKGFNVVHKFHSNPSFRATKDIQDRCNLMEEFLLRPNPQVHPSGIRDTFVKAVQGELVIDRKVMVMLKDEQARPRAYHLLPPDDIRPRFQVLLSWMETYGFKSEDQALGDIFQRFGVDLSNAAFVQVVDERILGAWSAEEMSVDITNPSDELDRWGYGTSCLELSLEATTILLMALQYNKGQFTTNWPEAFLILEGNVDQTGLEAFKKQIFTDIGPGGQQRLPIFSTGAQGSTSINKAQLLRLRDTMRDMQFVLLFRIAIALKAAAYRAHPSLINFAPDNGGQRMLLGSEDQEEIIATAQEEGFHSILDNIASWFTRVLIEPWFPDLEMVFSVADQPNDLERIQIGLARTQIGETVDEWRATEGMPPLEAVAGTPGTYVNSPLYFQQRMMLMQEQMMLEQALLGGAAGEEGFSGQEPAPRGGGQAKAKAGNGNGAKAPASKPRGEAKKKSLTIRVVEDDE